MSRKAGRNAEFLLSHIRYRTDVRRASAPDFRLGIFGEAFVDNVHVFGMLIRRELTTDELTKWFPTSWATELQFPWTYFGPRFDNAWTHATSGPAINLLSDEFNGSLLVEPASPDAFPLRLVHDAAFPHDDIIVADFIFHLTRVIEDYLSEPSLQQTHKQRLAA